MSRVPVVVVVRIAELDPELPAASQERPELPDRRLELLLRAPSTCPSPPWPSGWCARQDPRCAHSLPVPAAAALPERLEAVLEAVYALLAVDPAAFADPEHQRVQGGGSP